jgi:hypothetical protein
MQEVGGSIPPGSTMFRMLQIVQAGSEAVSEFYDVPIV